jgi:hypothetical protein
MAGPDSKFLEQLGTHTDAYKAYLDRLPSEKRERVVQSTKRISHGLHAVAPLTCLGPDKCPFLAHCPIPDRDMLGRPLATAPEQFPMGLQCVMESEYMAQKIGEYAIHLQVETTNPVEMSMVGELALCDLLKNRIMMVVSGGDKQGHGRDLMKMDVIGISENGSPTESSKIHPALEYVDKLHNRRVKILDKMMATRKAQTDLKMKMGGTESSSKMLDEIKKLGQVIADLGTGNKMLDLVPDSEPILLDEK